MLGPWIKVNECWVHIQGLVVFKQETERVNMDISGINELKWMGMGKFNLDGHYIYYLGKNPLEEMV